MLVQHLSARVALMWWVWLMLALLLAPALGRLHQVVHADALDRIHAGYGAQTETLRPAQHASPDTGHGLFHGLLPSHTATDCQLLDQLALGHAVPTACVVLHQQAPVQTVPSHHADATGAWPVVRPQARGPPWA